MAAARTVNELAEALWWGHAEACDAAAVGIALVDTEVRMLPGPGAPGVLPPKLDPLLVTEFAYAPMPLHYETATAVLAAYPILQLVGAPGPDGACAVVPLCGPAAPTGALVATWPHPRPFSVGDRSLLAALAGLCSAELDRIWPLEQERDAVERLRCRLRPLGLPAIAGAEVAVRHEPAGGTAVGVGFYDVIELETGAWRLVAGDVAGRGVDVAVLAGLAREAFRSEPDGGPAAALGRLDQLVREFGDPRSRMSAACVDLTRRGRGFTLTVARAGHPAPLVLRGTGTVLSMDPPGGPLGSWPDLQPAELGLELRSGDGLLLCAGGSGRGALAGDPRFAAVLAGCAGWSPDAVLDHVGLALAEHGRPVGDGTSFLALRVRGGPRGTAPGLGDATVVGRGVDKGA
ncbi:MAG TPA: PP2C family protein-serine/threonine phosphatase [Mycobacteriales bacterium]|nr:PP2C family protein-serine/threonine phosphatase [Mycobacteriales bacterium]